MDTTITVVLSTSAIDALCTEFNYDLATQDLADKPTHEEFVKAQIDSYIKGIVKKQLDQQVAAEAVESNPTNVDDEVVIS